MSIQKINSITEPALDTYPDVYQSFKITGLVILGMVLISPIKYFLDKIIGQEAARLLYYILAVGLPFWYVYSIRKNITDEHSFNLSIESQRIIPLLIFGTVVLEFGILAPLVGLIPTSESLNDIFVEVISHKGVFTFAAMVIAAPVLEELLFRGIILDGLLKAYTPLKSILISSFLFGLIHLNTYQLISGFLFGMFTGWIYYRTRSLLPSIIIHAVANLGAFISKHFIDNTEPSKANSLVEMYGGLTNSIAVIGGSMLIFLICLYYFKKEFMEADIKKVTTPAEALN